jgi:hypothetical protein
MLALTVVAGLSATAGLAVVLTQSGRFIPSPIPLPVSYERLERGFFSGLQERGTWVVQDGETWAELWVRIKGDVHAKPPAVDFSTTTVVVVAMGAKPTGGHSISVDSIYKIGDRMFVQLNEASPSPGCAVPQVLTQPYDIIKLAKADGFTFTVRESVNEC